MKPRLLDTFCKAGGCSRGYVEASFDVTGVDIEPQPRYLLSGATAFIQADALEYIARHGKEYDVIHASPPCQRYTRASFTKGNREKHPDLLLPTRQVLADTGRPYVIENVPGAPVADHPIFLCGLMFGLKVFRHRWFESSCFLWQPDHPSHAGKLIGKNGFCCVVGHGGGGSARMRTSFRREAEGFKDTKADWVTAMGIDWMARNEMSQAIPPAYTRHIGKQLLNALEGQP